MSSHRRGFTSEALTVRPEGHPEIGYEFEYAFPPTGPNSSSYGNIEIYTHSVVGWEKHIDGDGNDRISVRTKPIGHRVRRVKGISFQTCNLGHTHEVFEYDDNSPLKGDIPAIWGFG